MGIDWKRKLTSRKFWAAVLAYIIAEGLVDAANVGVIDIPLDDGADEQKPPQE